jgi:peptidylprolyl isomerase
MKRLTLSLAALFALSSQAFAQEDEPERSSSEAVAQQEAHPSPNAIVEAATAEEWVSIPAEDLLVMTLAPDAEGTPREVIIQLMPAPFSQGWVENIRTLARADWYAGTAVTRVQDNYVVQWGDPNAEDEATAKPLPKGLKVMGEKEYTQASFVLEGSPNRRQLQAAATLLGIALSRTNLDAIVKLPEAEKRKAGRAALADRYAEFASISQGWPLAGRDEEFWPVHCYGMVGVGRDYSPDTGSGAELYTVIGHAPRHLDRNIALVGRVIEGIEHLSSMTRGSGPLGFYTEEEAELRTPIQSIRVASDIPAEGGRPFYQYLSTESESFAKYAEARANRRDPWFIRPAGGADICNIPVPVREVD